MLWVSGSYFHRIESSRLDGSERKVVVEFSSGFWPAEISFDASNQRLYFLDDIYIRSCKLDGSDIKRLSTVPAITESVFVYRGFLLLYYWSPFDLRSTIRSFVIEGLRLHEENPSQFQSMGKITDLKVFDDRLQPSRKGPCDEQNGGCEQICLASDLFNRVCRCQFGFQSDISNGNTCFSSPVYSNFLLVSDWTNDRIYQLSLDTNDVQAVDIKKMTDQTGIAYDYTRKQVVYGLSTDQQIFSVCINGSKEAFIFSTGDRYGAYPVGFAIDFTTSNIYYTAVSTNRTKNPQGGYIAVLSVDGLHRRLVTDLDSPRAIVLHPSHGLMFWTNLGLDPHIGRANMDGKNSTKFMISGITLPHGLAIDYIAGRLYWSDGHTNVIASCNLDGSDRKLVLVDSEALLMDIVLDNTGNLYYTTWNRQYIAKLVLSQPNQIERLFENPELGRLDALAIYTTDVQLQNSLCQHSNGNCSTLCLPTLNGRTCACEDGVSLREDGKTCSNVVLSTTVTSPLDETVAKTDQPVTSIAVGGSVGFVLLIVAVVLTICCYRRRTIAKQGGGASRVISLNDEDVPRSTTELGASGRVDTNSEERHISAQSDVYYNVQGICKVSIQKTERP